MTEESIPLNVAVDCCKAYREMRKVRLFSQCWGCMRFSKSAPEKMCFYKPPNNTGCKFVNTVFKEANKVLFESI